MTVEPGVPMDELAKVALSFGMVPLMVPEFPGITVGGAINGGGVESTCHTYGHFHDTVDSVDVILGDGRQLTCSRTENADLFHAMATSYGTFAILVKVVLRVETATSHVHVKYYHFKNPLHALQTMEAFANSPNPPDYMDGLVVGPESSMVITGVRTNTLTSGLPVLSLRANRWDEWYYWHIKDKAPTMNAYESPLAAGKMTAQCFEEAIPMEDYLFRYDRGAFWMAKPGLDVFRIPYNIVVRVKYAWLCTTRQLYRMLHKLGDDLLARHYVVQDCILPSAQNADKFITYVKENLGIYPLWLLPIRVTSDRTHEEFGMPGRKKGQLVFNVGVYGQPDKLPFDPYTVNRDLETALDNLGGRKMLYAQSYYTEQEFWTMYNKNEYERIRKKYGSDTAFFNIYEKVCLGKRVEKMKGIKTVSFVNCFGDMLAWYVSLWQQFILPTWFCERVLKLDHVEENHYQVRATA
eukprot:Colp12_sorted_trinity150504_noHs@30183